VCVGGEGGGDFGIRWEKRGLAPGQNTFDLILIWFTVYLLLFPNLRGFHSCKVPCQSCCHRVTIDGGKKRLNRTLVNFVVPCFWRRQNRTLR